MSSNYLGGKVRGGDFLFPDTRTLTFFILDLYLYNINWLLHPILKFTVDYNTHFSCLKVTLLYCSIKTIEFATR